MQDEILFHVLFNLGLIPKNPLPGNLPTLDILNEWDINRDKALKKTRNLRVTFSLPSQSSLVKLPIITMTTSNPWFYNKANWQNWGEYARKFYSSLTEAWSYVTRILLFQVNYAVKSTLSTLTYTRNTPVELLRRYEEILSGSRWERGDFYRHSIKTWRSWPKQNWPGSTTTLFVPYVDLHDTKK